MDMLCILWYRIVLHVIALYRMVLHGIVLLASARGLYLARHLPTLVFWKVAVWLLGRPLYGPNCLKWPFLGPKMHIIPLYRMASYGTARYCFASYDIA